MSVSRRLAAPASPLYETEGDAGWLSGLAADERAFAEAMRVEGAAHIDLGAGARAVCDEVVAAVDPLFAPGVTRVQDAWLRSPAVRKLATHPDILRLLQAAYGRRPFAFQTLNFRRGTQQALHADTVHFNTAPAGFMAGVWIALEDIRPEAGPLVYKPGSHRLPVVRMADVGATGRPRLADYERHYEPRFGQMLEAADLPTEQVVLNKGEAFAWAANLAHGGAPIADPQATRRSLVAHYYFEGVVYYTPRLSDERGGRRYVRLPTDIASGDWVWPRRADGRRDAVALRSFAGALKTRLLRRPTIS